MEKQSRQYLKAFGEKKISNIIEYDRRMLISQRSLQKIVTQKSEEIPEVKH